MLKGKLNNNHVIYYGTLKECVDELWELIDFDLMEMPQVDYAADVWEDGIETVEEAYDVADGWFGFKNVGVEFDCDTIALMFAHYGGGGIESLELTGEDDEAEKETLMQRIGSSTDGCGYGVLKPDDYTVFEVIWK